MFKVRVLLKLLEGKVRGLVVVEAGEPTIHVFKTSSRVNFGCLTFQTKLSLVMKKLAALEAIMTNTIVRAMSR
jgi:hypothetical protein